jgi:hypothetical protein
MNKIKVVTYTESREAFFNKKLKQEERGLDNLVKYGTDPDACAEQGEIVSFYRDALACLRECAERREGCEYCLQGEDLAYGQDSVQRTGRIYLDGNLLTADLYTDSMAVAVCFCPMCGRKLEGSESHAKAD